MKRVPNSHPEHGYEGYLAVIVRANPEPEPSGNGTILTMSVGHGMEGNLRLVATAIAAAMAECPAEAAVLLDAVHMYKTQLAPQVATLGNSHNVGEA